jgi:hypothetical protein
MSPEVSARFPDESMIAVEPLAENVTKIVRTKTGEPQA